MVLETRDPTLAIEEPRSERFDQAAVVRDGSDPANRTPSSRKVLPF